MTTPRTGTIPRRVAMLSMHTSPLDQPGTGDAGGLNVYVVETAKRLAAAGVAVEIFTRATSGSLAPAVELAPGVLVRNLVAGPFEGLRKEELPGQLCAMSAGLLREEAYHPEGWYDLIHSHYWLSGQVGWLAKERWGIPLVHTMHTMARVKNLSLAEGDRPEPQLREIGEQQVVEVADRLVANTEIEAGQLTSLYSADPAKIAVVNPGVDIETFAPDPGGHADRRSARRAIGVDPERRMLLFVGRLQPLKAPDVLVRAVAAMLEMDPGARDEIQVVICGGPSGSGLEHPTALADLAEGLGIADVVTFRPPVSKDILAQYYRAADICAVPSHSESFGLVAVEAQACGTPIVAADVDGLRIAVADGLSGVLVQGHDPGTWAKVLADLLRDDARLERMSAAAVQHAASFSWQRTTEELIAVYSDAVSRART